MSPLLFQYCPKIAVVDRGRVLVCRRKGEADYDGVFSLIGGKMEHTDASIVAGLQREKNEEVGEEFRIRLLPRFSIDTHFIKKDGTPMILPHFFAEFVAGDVRLSDEYSEYAWLSFSDLSAATNIIDNLRWIVPALHGVGAAQPPELFVEI
jgi:8-oxo-dGTP pyrophosphatase MutT (NUDIX family)